MSRRGPGEGSAPRQRPDGRWESRYWLDTGDGKRVRRSVYGDSAAACRKALQAAIRDRDQGIVPINTRMTVGEYLDSWIAEAVEPHKSSRTTAIYRTVIERQLRPGIGARAIGALTSSHVTAILADLRAQGYASRTIALAHNVLRSALTHAVRTRRLARNVASEVATPKGKAPVPRTYLTEDEIGRLFETAESSMETVMLALALTMGPRRGALAAMRWRDIDFERGIVRVPPMKGRTEPLVLPLVEDLARHLRAHRARQRLDARGAGVEWTEAWPVLAFAFGKARSGDVLYDVFRRWQARAGVPHHPFHSLRHSCASHLLSLGVSFREIQEILGHASGSSVTALYAHVMPAVTRKSLEGISRLLPPVKDQETG